MSFTLCHSVDLMRIKTSQEMRMPTTNDKISAPLHVGERREHILLSEEGTKIRKAQFDLSSLLVL